MAPPTRVSVSVTLPPSQKVVGPPAVILALGFLFTVTLISLERLVAQSLLVSHV